MKVKVILSAVAMMLFVGFAAQAQEVKIGYTSVEFIMDLMPEMEQIGADIQDYQTQLQTNIQTKGADFQRQVQAYQQAAPTMTEEARNAKEAELTKLQGDLQKYEQDAQVSYQRKLQELLEPVQTKVVNAINAVAAENNYTHIFAETAGQSPILLYTKEEDKFTELVLAKLGLKMPTPPAGAPSGK
jgi:outer membrane protein